MIAMVQIHRCGDMIQATILSPLSDGGAKIPLDSDRVLQVFESKGSYVFVSLFVLDEDAAIKYLAQQSPIDITLKSPNITEVVSL